MSGYEQWVGWMVVGGRDPEKVLVVESHRPGAVLVKMPGVADPFSMSVESIYETESAAWMAKVAFHQRASKAEQERAERCRRKAMQADAREIKARLLRGDA